MSDPKFRPSDSFWPYVEMPEEPTPEELAELDPDLYNALFGPRDRPFSVTLVFPPFEGEEYPRAVAMAKQAAEYREGLTAGEQWHRARFLASDALALRDLFEIVDKHPGCQVLIDDRPIPYARELWLPLVWFQLLP